MRHKWIALSPGWVDCTECGCSKAEHAGDWNPVCAGPIVYTNRGW